MQDVWHVKLAGGDARMTLDELDAAYQAGTIDEATLVRESDDAQWQTLGALLGVDAPSAPAPSAPVPPAPPVMEHGASLRPIAADLDELEAHQLRPKRRGALIAAAAAALIVIGVGVAITKAGASVEKDAPKAAAAAVVAPTAVAVTPTSDDNTAPADRLSDEQKKALQQKDKDLAAKAQKAREERDAKQRTFRPAVKSGPVFQQGGDPHDPLNAKL